MTKYKLTILCPYPNNGAPSQRFRFEQQLPYLKEHFNIQQLSFWSERSNKILYSKGNTFLKTLGFLKGILRRKLHLIQSLNSDVILIHREIVPIGTIFFEWTLSKVFKKKIVFDFDDAIWHLDSSEQNKRFEWIKNPNKTQKIIQLSSLVLAGNSYLANYTKQFNDTVEIIPTTIDTEYHHPSKTTNEKICIGWTGSITTVKHFETIIPALKQIAKKYDNIYFKLIGDQSFKSEELNLEGTKWNQATEIDDLQELDIGIMPLPDDEWAKGKCGFKGLQYMAIGIPAIMSPVGVNSEIITDGANGFLADIEQEWVDKLSKLIESKELRDKLGKEGRKTIIEKYSVKSQKEVYLKQLNSLIN